MIGVPQIPDKAKLNLFGAANLIGQATDFKLTLHTSAWTPDMATLEVFADVTGELPTGNGYTAGGISIGAMAAVITSRPTTYQIRRATGGIAAWTATGSGIPAWRYAVIRAVGTYAGKVDPLLCFVQGNFGSDVPLTPAGTTVGIGTVDTTQPDPSQLQLAGLAFSSF